MRTILSLGLIAVGLAGCGAISETISEVLPGSGSKADPTGWSRYDGVPVRGNAALEKSFAFADDKCSSRNQAVYKDCMVSRGFTDEPMAAPPQAAPAVAAAAPTDWRAKAVEARMTAAQLQDPAARKVMNSIADNYDRLASSAEGRSAGGAKPRAPAPARY